MDAELKQYLDDMKRDLLDGIKGDLMAHVDSRIEAVKRDLIEIVGGRIDASEQRMKDFIREADHDLETKVITEFHKWGRTSDMRTRQALSETSLLGERLLAVEDRITALERAKAS